MKEVLMAGGKVMVGQSLTKPEVLGVFIGFILWLFILLFFGQYLWNNVLIKLIPGIKPVTSVWQIVGIVLLISILKC